MTKNLKIYSIYKSTNKIDGKSYIGFDSNWYGKHNRKYEHEELDEYDCVFHRAIKKHGKSNFEWEIIYQSLDGDCCLNEMEKYFIKKYNCKVPNGYNMTDGGEGTLGLIWLEESRKKLSKSVSGIKNPNYGRKGALFSKSWTLVNYEIGILYLKLDNLNQFCKENGLNMGAMCAVARKERKHHKNWQVFPFK